MRRNILNLRRENFPMKKLHKGTAFPLDRVHELRLDLARKITELMGPAEDKATDISGVSLHQRYAPTPPCRTTYHPGVIVIAQGRKQVNLGRPVSFTMLRASCSRRLTCLP
jgi:hypothetical protein